MTGAGLSPHTPARVSAYSGEVKFLIGAFF